MSLNELIADYRKPWLNVRVNELTIDESASLKQVSIGESGAIIGEYSETSINGTIEGTLVITPFVVTSNLNIIGKRVTMRIPIFTITNANQNASGTILYNLTIPSGFEPVADTNFTIISRDAAGGNRGARLQYDSIGNIFAFYDGYSSDSFTKGVSDLGLVQDIYITWIIP